MENTEKAELRERPPRYLSFFTRVKLLLGGHLTLFGAGFFWFGMIFVLVFGGQSELKHMFDFGSTWDRTDGVVLRSETTNAEVNGRNLYKYYFRYFSEGETLEGMSYDFYRPDLIKNAQVEVEVKSSNSAVARIVGMRSEMFPAWVGFVFIFPFVGIIFFIIGIFKNTKALKLIENGHFSRGKIIGTSPTNTRINDRPVRAYEFEFEVKNMKFTTTCKTHLYERVEDEEKELILYDANDPTYAIVYDAYTSAPEITRFGKLEQASLFTAFLYSLIHIAGLLINGIIYWFLF